NAERCSNGPRFRRGNRYGPGPSSNQRTSPATKTEILTNLEIELSLFLPERNYVCPVDGHDLRPVARIGEHNIVVIWRPRSDWRRPKNPRNRRLAPRIKVTRYQLRYPVAAPLRKFCATTSLSIYPANAEKSLSSGRPSEY